MTSILVTGAAGFIGAHVAQRLAQAGHAVVGCDSFNAYYDPALKHARVQALLTPHAVVCEPLDVTDGKALRALMARHQVAQVVHLAAQAGVRHSIHAPLEYAQANLLGFTQVLEAAQAQGIAHVVYASSSSVYGARNAVPFREADRTDEPVSFYAATKRANELMAHAYAGIHRLPATGLRFFTVYGPWGRPDMAVMSFSARLLRGEPITLYAGGTLWRDFTYIDDVVDAVVALLACAPSRAEPAVPHRIVNVGHAEPVRVDAFVAALGRALGVTPLTVEAPMQPGDVPRTAADVTLLTSLTGVQPRVGLDDGLARFAAWYRAYVGAVPAGA